MDIATTGMATAGIAVVGIPAMASLPWVLLLWALPLWAPLLCTSPLWGYFHVQCHRGHHRHGTAALALPLPALLLWASLPWHHCCGPWALLPWHPHYGWVQGTTGPWALLVAQGHHESSIIEGGHCHAPAAPCLAPPGTTLPRCRQHPQRRSTRAVCPPLCRHSHLLSPSCAHGHSSCSRRSCAPFQGLSISPGFWSWHRCCKQCHGARTGVAAPGLTCDMGGLASAFPAGAAVVAAVLPGRGHGWQDSRIGVWTVLCWGTLGCCPGWGEYSGCCAVPGCGHLGAVSGDTGHPGVLCCARL